MKKIGIILVLFLSFAFTTSIINETKSVSIEPESQLVIKGTTNVSSFKCKFDIKEINNPILLYYKVIDDKMVFEKAKLVLNNDCFDCGHRGINSDFMDLLKSDEYPEILLELKEIKMESNRTDEVNALVKLCIAGKSKLYHLPLHYKEDSDIQVRGTLKLNITDFGLKAPKKALGLIVVSEEIEIKFDMVFRESKI